MARLAYIQRKLVKHEGPDITRTREVVVMAGGVTVNSNIASLNAQRHFATSTASIRDSFARLSSGLRINKASDDTAGLAIAKCLDTDNRVFSQGIRNLNDGVSVVNIAENALEGLTTIVIRLEELAEQAANGTLGHEQREALNEEAQVLSKEYWRISHTAEFNGINLLDGSVQSLSLQGGFGEDGTITLSAALGGLVGTGTFGAACSFRSLTSGYSWASAVGDLNEDGFLDLVTSGKDNNNDGYATVQLGNGDGSFQAAISYANESRASFAVALGDLNGDGILDLVTAGYSDSAKGFATVRLGLGDGSFGTAASYATEAYASRAMLIRDLNGDGVMDLLTAGRDGSSHGNATVQFGNGDGSFCNATTYATENGWSYAATVGDVNGDGIVDLVTAGYGGSYGYTTIRLGNADGSFRSRTSYVTESLRSFSVALGDLNGDGVLDLVTAGETDSTDGEVSVRLGKGDGSFGEIVSYTAESAISRDLALADLNGDSVLDLVTTGQNDDSTGTATIRLGAGDGSFGAAISYAAESYRSLTTSLGDFNCDGVLDLVTAGEATSIKATATVRLANTKDGAAPLLDFDLSTFAGAQQALPIFQRKLQQLAAQRAALGTYQSRLSVAVTTLQVAAENYASAKSQITDADIAEESASLTKNRILQQAGQAVLAQANQAPILALVLLESP